MAELEKVIKAWECCSPFNRKCNKCPYDEDCYHDEFCRDAISDMVELLKEHKADIEELTAQQDARCDACAKRLELLKEKQPKKGHWKENDDRNFQCSECGHEGLSFDDVFIYEMELDKFCPNCGADMREGR